MAQLASDHGVNRDSPSRLCLVADGGTDQRILERIVQTCSRASGVARASLKVEHLRGVTLRDDIDRYWAATKKADSPSILKARDAFVKGTISLLESTSSKFKDLIGRPLSCRDRVILATDAERRLAHVDRYFDEWAWVVPRLLEQSVEKWYHRKVAYGYPRANLPVILPVVFFPSIDVLVAAARAARGDAFDPRGLDAPQLKRQLYGTDELRSVSPEAFERVALEHLTDEGIESIWKMVPEVRLFLLRLMAS